MSTFRRNHIIDSIIERIGKTHGSLIGDFATIIVELRKIILTNSVNNHTVNHILKEVYTKTAVFREKLFEHIQYEDNVVIATIRRTCPDASLRLDVCMEDHNKLKKLTNNLCKSAKEAKADANKLSDTARLILASLLQHINEEDNFFLSLLLNMNHTQLETFHKNLRKLEKLNNKH